MSERIGRFLFVVPPLAGHVNPTVGVGAALRRRGHVVAWAGQPDVVGPLVGPDAAVFACEGFRHDDEVAQRPATLRGAAALKFLWEQVFVPLAEMMIPGVRRAVEVFRPDVLIVDQQTVGGALVADALGIPWATSSAVPAELSDPLAGVPKVHDWVLDQIATLQQRVGANRPTVRDPRISPYLVVAFTTEALTGPGPSDLLGDRLRFVGPSISARPAPDFPWEWLDSSHPTVLITLGTVNDDAGGRFLNACADAIAARPGLRAVLLDPTGAVASVPANVLVRHRVPQLELLPRVDAVVCHAGHNTVCESLYHGVPLVVAPIRDDQPIVAQQAVDAGAAVRIRFGRATAEHVGAAIDEILAVGSFRENALRVGRSFRAAGGAEAAAGHLERLAGHVCAAFTS